MKTNKFTPEMLESFKQYVSTYKIEHSLDSQKVFIEDMLYGLGIAIDTDYKYAPGLREFKKRLYERHIKGEF